MGTLVNHGVDQQTADAAQFFSEREVAAGDEWGDPSEFFEACSSGLEKLTLKGWLDGKPPAKTVYRGQANSAHGISSNLSRQIPDRDGKPAAEFDLCTAERAVLTEMRTQGLGYGCSDLQLLYLLQHQEIPTRLIDVSRSCLPSLYFAVNNHSHLDGRLFIIQIPATTRQLNVSSEDLPWAGKAVGTENASSDWTNSVYLIDDLPLDPRMIAQDGAFLVGGIAVNDGPCQYMLRTGKKLGPAARLKVSTLNLQFPKNDAELKEHWGGRAWTIRIPANWKPELTELLAGLTTKINEDSMMPDFVGSRRPGLKVARQPTRN